MYGKNQRNNTLLFWVGKYRGFCVTQKRLKELVAGLFDNLTGVYTSISCHQILKGSGSHLLLQGCILLYLGLRADSYGEYRQKALQVLPFRVSQSMFHLGD